MALSATCIFEVRNGGSDTLNGGFFNTGATMNSNLAATSGTGNSPVVSSATYTFVAGDVGHWVFIKSGTNWIPGWYQIASVAGGAATLSASVGQALLYTANFVGPRGFNTVAGCATTASPTSGSWTIDYSQNDAVVFSLTGLTTAAANAIILTASATVAMIGNGIVITGGTNFTTGYYQIDSVSAGVSVTVDRNCTSAAGAAGTAGIGGALATPGKTSSLVTSAGMIMFVKYNATPYTATSASTNITSGCVSCGDTTYWAGYDSSRYFFNTDANRPTFKIAASTATLFAGNNVGAKVANFILDGDMQTSSKGMNNGAGGWAWRCKFMNFTAGAYTPNQFGTAIYCSVTGCSTTIPFNAVNTVLCEMYANSVTPITAGSHFGTLSYSNTGGGHGFVNFASAVRCVAYNNGGHGFNANNTAGVMIINCIAEANATYGYFINIGEAMVLNCADYNNTSGRISNSGYGLDNLKITGTGSFFTNAASSDFSLNSTAGAGALCRAAGFPSTFPAGLTASYADVGAAQHQDSGGGTAGMLFIPSLDGI